MHSQNYSSYLNICISTVSNLKNSKTFHMKTHFLFLSFFLISTISNSQITFKYNKICVGDEIEKQQVEYKNPGGTGENLIWDFSNLKPLNDKCRIIYTEPRTIGDSIYVMGKDTFAISKVDKESLIVGLEDQTRYFYRYSGDSLLLLGHENSTTLMHHKDPIVVMIYPMNYIQKCNDSYVSNGIYSARISMHTQGNVKLCVDAWGKIILPSGDTLNHVIRTKTVQTVKEQDSINYKIISNPLNMIITTYLWYAQGYRYPIFESIQTATLKDSTQSIYYSTSFFYPPQEEHYLCKDEENLVVLDSLWNLEKRYPVGYADFYNQKKVKGISTNSPFMNSGNQKSSNNSTTKGKSNSDVQVNRDTKDFTFNIYPNPVKLKLQIEYRIDKKTNVDIILYSINGKRLQGIYKKNLFPGSYSDIMDCSMLPSGSYMLRLITGDKDVNEVIIKE